MTPFKVLSAVLRGRWFLDQRWAEQHLPMIAALIEGKPFSFSAKPSAYHDDSSTTRREGTNEAETNFWMHAVSPVAGVVKVNRWTNYTEAPEGSVAVIPVVGPVMKYGGECGEPGSSHMATWIKNADAAHNISSIILTIDSPGGMVDGTQSLVEAISNSKKPVIAFIDDGMAASAAYWIASAADEVYASRLTDQVGSIGVYTTLFDMKGRLEQMGVKVHEIYAPQSTEKNLDYKKALGGDYSLVENELSVLATAFIDDVKSKRKGNLNSKFNPFKGAMYFADEAVSAGLIDGIKSFEEVVLRAQNFDSNKKNNTKMFGNKFKALSKSAGANQVSADELSAMNDELIAEGIQAVAIIDANAVDHFNNATETAQRLADATAEVAQLNEQVRDLQAEVAQLKTDPEGGQATPITQKEKEGAKVSKPMTSWEEKAAKRKALYDN